MEGKITQHFSWSEAACKSGTPVPPIYEHNVRKVAGNLELIRLALQCPIIIDSWYMTYKTLTPNDRFAETSGETVLTYHLDGRAVRFHTENFEPLDIFKIVNAMMNMKLITQGGLFLFDDCVHYDIRGEKLIRDFTTDSELDKFINNK